MAVGWTPNHALAVSFSLTGHTFTFQLSAGTTYTATLATGTRRVWLAPASSDLARLTVAAMNAPAPALPGGVSFAATIDDDGYISITCSGDTWKSTGPGSLSTTQTGKALGWYSDTGGYAATQTAGNRPRYFGLFCAAYDGTPEPHRAGAAEVTTGGQVYSFSASGVSYQRRIRLALLPWNVTRASEASSPTLPFWPDDPYLNSIGDVTVARGWSLLDLLDTARNADCALAIDNWQTLKTSLAASDLYLVGRIAPESLLSPRAERQNARWPRYVEHELGFWVPTTGGTGSRA